MNLLKNCNWFCLVSVSKVTTFSKQKKSIITTVKRYWKSVFSVLSVPLARDKLNSTMAMESTVIHIKGWSSYFRSPPLSEHHEHFTPNAQIEIPGAWMPSDSSFFLSFFLSCLFVDLRCDVVQIRYKSSFLMTPQLLSLKTGNIVRVGIPSLSTQNRSSKINLKETHNFRPNIGI